LGYTEEELKTFLHPPELADFWGWMTGQTHAIGEDGTRYYYRYDVERFLGWIRLGKETYFD
jgi:hypothetical protein